MGLFAKDQERKTDGNEPNSAHEDGFGAWVWDGKHSAMLATEIATSQHRIWPRISNLKRVRLLERPEITTTATPDCEPRAGLAGEAIVVPKNSGVLTGPRVPDAVQGQKPW